MLTRFRELGDRWGIGFAAGWLAQIAAREQRYEEAAALYEERLAMDEALGHSAGGAEAMLFLADVAIVRGDYARAVASLAESLRWTKNPGQSQLVPNEWMIRLLERAARIAALQGGAVRAVRLCGALTPGREVLEATGALLSDRDAEYDCMVTSLRTRLDDEAFATAWAEGRAMTLEQAIAYALEEAPDGNHR